MTYYDTTRLVNSELATAKRDAGTQDDLIALFFADHPDRDFTAAEVLAAGVLPEGAPLTSVRRSLNSLMKSGLVEKTRNKRPGVYGKPNYAWKLCKSVRANVQGELF